MADIDADISQDLPSDVSDPTHPTSGQGDRVAIQAAIRHRDPKAHRGDRMHCYFDWIVVCGFFGGPGRKHRAPDFVECLA